MKLGHSGPSAGPLPSRPAWGWPRFNAAGSLVRPGDRLDWPAFSGAKLGEGLTFTSVPAHLGDEVVVVAAAIGMRQLDGLAGGQVAHPGDEEHGGA